MAPTNSAVFWSQSPKAGLAWPTGQDTGREEKERRGEVFSFFSVCVHICVCVWWGVSEGGGDVCFLSLCQKLLGAMGLFAVPCECRALTLCIVCQRLEGCHALGVVHVRCHCVLCARIVAVMCVMSVVWDPVDAMGVEGYDLCDMRFVNPKPSSRHL